MNILQFNNQDNSSLAYQDLTIELSDYGLKPEEWSITKEDNFSYKIENKKEPSFYFRGKTLLQNGKRRWKAIQLAGL
jgi:hypothetical protein